MPPLLTLLTLLAGSSLHAAETPPIVSLQTQRKGDTTYFVVTVRPPEDLRKPTDEWSNLSSIDDGERLLLARTPQLVPQDKNTNVVYSRLNLPIDGGCDSLLRFVAKVRGKEKAKLLLLYPKEEKSAHDKKLSLIRSLSRQTWVEASLTLDFSQSTSLKAFEGVRTTDMRPVSEDLEGQWALAQARHLAVLETQTRDFSFFPLARTLTGRKYQVPAPTFAGGNTPREFVHRQVYEMTTGAAAITQSLALHRLRDPGERDDGGGGIVKDLDSPQARQAARRFFGFVPVSPDGSSYRYDRRRDDVTNEVYGSLRWPILRDTLPEQSPLAQLLGQLRTLRVDLRFREDGVHTILTIDRKLAKK